MTDHRVLAARQCQRVVETERGGGQCPRESTWARLSPCGRQIYLVVTCEQHMSGLIHAAPLEDESKKATSAATSQLYRLTRASNKVHATSSKF